MLERAASVVGVSDIGVGAEGVVRVGYWSSGDWVPVIHVCCRLIAVRVGAVGGGVAVLGQWRCCGRCCDVGDGGVAFGVVAVGGVAFGGVAFSALAVLWLAVLWSVLWQSAGVAAVGGVVVGGVFWRTQCYDLADTTCTETIATATLQSPCSGMSTRKKIPSCLITNTIDKAT